MNDDEATLRGIAEWIVAELGPQTPWHVTRFTPYLELPHLSATPISTLERAVRSGHEAGLDFVYVGNVPGHAGENTYCPHCHRLVVRRTGFAVEDVALRGTFCDMCGDDLNVRTVSTVMAVSCTPASVRGTELKSTSRFVDVCGRMDGGP